MNGWTNTRIDPTFVSCYRNLGPCCLGTKYKYARQWQTHCVTPQWLYDSIESGYCLPEKDYNVETQGAKKEAKSKEEEGREWVHTLEEFKVPSVSENYFLDGCKVCTTYTCMYIYVCMFVCHLDLFQWLH